MNPIEFIRKNIVTQLVGEGFPEDVARGGGRRGRGSLPPHVTSQPQRALLRRLSCAGAPALPLSNPEKVQRRIEWKTKQSCRLK